MRRFLSVAVGFAAFSFSAVAATVQPPKAPAAGQTASGKIMLSHPKNVQFVPNYKAAYIIDQRKRRGE